MFEKVTIYARLQLLVVADEHEVLGGRVETGDELRLEEKRSEVTRADNNA